MSALQIQLDRIRRRRWLPLAVMAIALIATLLYSVVQKPAYTATRALRVESLDRGPEQDAVLAQGYVEYFNLPSSKQVFRAMTRLSPDVTFSARNSATSPILYIEATAPTADLAAASATGLAETFRDEINAQVRASNQRTITDLRAQMSAAQDQLNSLPSGSSESSLIGQDIESLRKGINDLQTTRTNQLTDVLATAGVVNTSPKVLPNLALALVGGLILGIVVALALASAEDRLVSPANGADAASSRPSGQDGPGKRVRNQSVANGEQFRV